MGKVSLSVEKGDENLMRRRGSLEETSLGSVSEPAFHFHPTVPIHRQKGSGGTVNPEQLFLHASPC